MPGAAGTSMAMYVETEGFCAKVARVGGKSRGGERVMIQALIENEDKGQEATSNSILRWRNAHRNEIILLYILPQDSRSPTSRAL